MHPDRDGGLAMSTHNDQSLSQAIVRALGPNPDGIAPAELIDLLLKKDFLSQDILHTIRQKLDTGELGLNSEMLFFLKRQLA